MTTAKERKALLEFAEWHRGKPMEDVQVFNVWHGLDLMPALHDEPDRRALIAESLAYDGTDGP